MHPINNLLLAVAAATWLGASPALVQAAQTETGALHAARQEGAIGTALALNRLLSAFDIKVAVTQGRARLSGTVENAVERELAERIALAVDGIDKVDNQLQTDPALAGETETGNRIARTLEDATLAAMIESRLLWSNVTQDRDIEVVSDDGVVTLKGRARSPEARELAGSLAAGTAGVISVNNLVSLSAADSIAARTQPQVLDATAPMSDGWVTRKVISSLVYSRDLDGRKIKVQTREGVVTLNGAVGNFAEKELAVEIVRNIRGVKGVNADALRVTPRSTG